MATQILGRVRLVFKGEYNAGTTYQKLDTVHHEGIAYSAVSGGFSGVTPGTDATKWAVIIDTGTNPGITARLDSDTAKLSSLSAAVDTNTANVSNLRADVDSDSSRLSSLTATVDTNTANVSNLRADVDSDTVIISNLSSAVSNLRADRDSEHGLIISKINQVADSDFIMGQLNPKITEIIARLDSDTIAISAAKAQTASLTSSLNSGYTFSGGLTISSGQAFNFDSLAFTDAHKLEIRNTSNSIVFGGYVLDTDSNSAN